MSKMDFSNVDLADLRAPDFQSERERDEFMEEMYNGERPIPITLQAMGVDFTDEEYVAEAIRLGGIGMLSAAAPGFRVREQDLRALTHQQRKALFLDANDKRAKEQVAYVRERQPFGILGGNAMLKLTGYRRSVDAFGATGKVNMVAAGAGILNEEEFRQFQQYPGMEIMPIVSSVTAARWVNRSAKRVGARIRILLVELADRAGGHLGKRNAQEAMEPDDPVEIREGIAKYLPGVPVVLAGGIAYSNQIKEAFAMGYQGVGIGIRGLLTKESKLSDDIIRDVYLEPQYKVVTNDRSPTGYPGRYIDVPEEARTPEERLAYAQRCVRTCISCIEPGSCLFLQEAKDPNGSHFCIGEDLPQTRRGERGGIYFASTERDQIMNDAIYRDEQGNRRVPTMEEMLQFMLTHDEPEMP